MNIRCGLISLALTLLGSISGGQRIAPVGSKAPPIAISRWLQGGPSRGPRNFQVVVFWATWCLPCLEEMPLLGKLARKSRRPISFVAVDSLEHIGGNGAGSASKYISPAWAGLNIGTDSGQLTATAWLGRPENAVVPYSFLLDRTGTIVWEGPPSAGLTKIVTAILQGNSSRADLQSAARSAWLELKENGAVAAGYRSQILHKQFASALRRVGELRGSLLADSYKPDVMRYLALAGLSKAKARAYGDWYLRAWANEPVALISLSDVVVEGALAGIQIPKDPALGLELLRRARLFWDPREPGLLARMAAACVGCKQYQAGISFQRQALESATDKRFAFAYSESVPSMRRDLASYQDEAIRAGRGK